MIRKSLKKLDSLLRQNDYVTLNAIELNTKAVINNVGVIKRNNPNNFIIPVLKANAYGHGLSQMAEILNSVDCEFLAVDGYFEAASIRYVTKHRILVMGYIRPENFKLLDFKHCSFVVQDVESLKQLGTLSKSVKIHIEVNTGMNRLGLRLTEIDNYLKTLNKFKNLELEGVMTHLADADNPDDTSYNDDQVKLFEEAVTKIREAGFSPKYIHISQTAGSTKVKTKLSNAIRLGIGLYGVNPLSPKDPKSEKLSDLKPVLELKSTVIKVIDIKKGERVSYNGIFTAPKDMRIAVLPLGYYEGIPRDLSNLGYVTSGNFKLPIVGRVCMNHTMIDLKNSDLVVGNKVTVISANNQFPNSVKQICQTFNLFSYSFLTGMSSSIRRVIV